MQLDTVRRLKIETSESGAAETRARLLTVADALAQVEKQSASLARQHSVSAQAEAQQRTVFAATAAGVGSVGKAFVDVAGVVKDHPVLVTAAALGTARALGTLTPALMAASVATRAFANDNAIMAAGAGVAARGLASGAAATAAAAAGAKTLAESLSPAVLATRLLGTALGVALPFLGPIALGLTAIKLGSEGLEKAYLDLEKLIKLGERAEKLDISGPFLKAFGTLGKGLRLDPSEIESALGTASGAVRDKFGQPNALTNSLSTLYSQGFTGGEVLQGAKMAETAKTTEERIRAAVVAMGELDALGQRFAELDIAEKFFGSAVAERLRLGQTTAAQMLVDLDAASKAEVLKQEDVARALELSRNIEAVKKEISDAWAVSLDFSGAAVTLNSAWLEILKTTRDVSISINDGIGGAIDGSMSKLKQFGDYWTSLGNASIWKRIGDALPRDYSGVQLVDPPQMQGPPIPAGYLPPIGSRIGTEMLGPPMPAIGREPKERAAAAPSAETMTSMDRYLRDIEKAHNVQKAEYETIGLGNQARERALDLAKAQAAAQTDFQRGLRESATLTDDETQRIIAAADATVLWRDKARELQDAISFTSDATKDFAKTFVSDMRAGKSAMEALADAVDKLAAKLSDKALDGAIDALLGTGKTSNGGGLLSLLGIGRSNSGGWDMGTGSYSDVLPGSGGFANGGFTGRGGRYEPAGIVHRGEYVFDAASTSRIGVDILEGLRRGGSGYDVGGLVGGPSMADVANLNLPVANMNAPSSNEPVTLNFNPTLNIGPGNGVTQGEARTMMAQMAQQFRRELPAMIKAARGRGAL